MSNDFPRHLTYGNSDRRILVFQVDCDYVHHNKVRKDDVRNASTGDDETRDKEVAINRIR